MTMAIEQSPIAIKITDRQNVETIKLLGEKRAHKNKRHTGTERLLNDAGNAAFNKAPRQPENGFGSEPRGKSRRNDHGQRKAATGKREVVRIFDASGCPDADADRNEDIEQDKTNQRHLNNPSKKTTLNGETAGAVSFLLIRFGRIV